MDKAPDAYRTISEVGEDLDLPQHVLRFWETRFTHIKPLKRGGGRRYYRPDDVELLKGIRHLLYKEGYTIKGVQRILKEQGPRAVMAFCQPALPDEPAPVAYYAPREPVAPPPAYAPQPAYAPPPPQPAPVAPPPAPFFEAQPEVSRVEWRAPEPFVPDAPAMAPVPDTPVAVAPPFELPPLESMPAEMEALPLPGLEAPVAPGVPGQVSMFRGGLKRAEAAPETVAPPPVSYMSSAYALPAASAPPPGQGRALLLQALEELSVVRGALDRLLAQRSA